MPNLKVMSGKDVIRILLNYGFNISGQKGSHIKLLRIKSNGKREILTIPNHRELDKGTLKAIIRQASVYIQFSELERHFYHK